MPLQFDLDSAYISRTDLWLISEACDWQQNKQRTRMLLRGPHTTLSCMVKLVALDNSHQHSSNSHSSSSSQLLVLMGRQQAPHLQHSHNQVSTYICQIVLHVLALVMRTRVFSNSKTWVTQTSYMYIYDNIDINLGVRSLWNVDFQGWKILHSLSVIVCGLYFYDH